MAHCVQLELFDLKAYTSVTVCSDVYVLPQVKENSQETEYEQLELNLLLEQSDDGSLKFLQRAA